MFSIWVSTEAAIRMHHFDEGIRAKMVQWPIFLCIHENRWPHHKNGQNVTKKMLVAPEVNTALSK